MKFKLITIILGIVLVISMGGHIYLAKVQTDTRGEVTALSSQLLTADDQITGLQRQLAELQAQAADLQEELNQRIEQIGTLESTIEENNAVIADLEKQSAEESSIIAVANGDTVNSEPTDANLVDDDYIFDEQLPESGDNGNNGGNNDDGDNTFPGKEGYEGPKEGYRWIPGVGYVPDDTITGPVGEPLTEDALTGIIIGY